MRPSELILLKSIAELSRYRAQALAKGSTVGFVPTMGALHQGHLNLVEKSNSENDLTIVSIFVNPTQFNNPEDLEKYPRTIEKDAELLGDAKADALFIPNFNEIYADQYRFKVSESDFSKKLCGQFRPGHFDGVLTVVMKLLNLTQPHRAYFGEKDFQQMVLIEDMVKAFFMPVQIVRVPTMRETDGLAMSSRNQRLDPQQRLVAGKLNGVLTDSKSATEAKEKLEALGFRVDYIEDVDGRRLAAAFIGNVRLIDNVQI